MLYVNIIPLLDINVGEKEIKVSLIFPVVCCMYLRGQESREETHVLGQLE